MSSFELFAAWASIAGCGLSIWAAIAATMARTAARSAQNTLRGQWLVHPSLTGLQDYLQRCYDCAHGHRWDAVQTIVGYALASVLFIKGYHFSDLTQDDHRSLDDVFSRITKLDDLTRRQTQPEGGGLSREETNELAAMPESIRQAQNKIHALAAKLQRKGESWR